MGWSNQHSASNIPAPPNSEEGQEITEGCGDREEVWPHDDEKSQGARRLDGFNPVYTICIHIEYHAYTNAEKKSISAEMVQIGVNSNRVERRVGMSGI